MVSQELKFKVSNRTKLIWKIYRKSRKFWSHLGQLWIITWYPWSPSLKFHRDPDSADIESFLDIGYRHIYILFIIIYYKYYLLVWSLIKDVQILFGLYNIHESKQIFYMGLCTKTTQIYYPSPTIPTHIILLWSYIRSDIFLQGLCNIHIIKFFS